ncbi:MAG: TetM/TetW/TetO/TetS family tetracycline resistance ribosomal protection protein [Dorea sp.]|nr:TetM/TetW/TetO/TetS family tetracycline resistance ribosomal protection protein [Dorea sp.]
MKHIAMGILAHVDAGKTTLSESILYLSGQIRRMGRVDHKDAFLDTYALERERGITIFSKQAMFQLGDYSVTLLDTPGHVDFSAEMERTLQVLDYAILVINGADGVQGHTRTLWSLLKRYQIPVFLFVNKMDQYRTDLDLEEAREKLLHDLKDNLDSNIVAFDVDHESEAFMEELATTDEALLETYLEELAIDEGLIPSLIRSRKVFPCYFGSALKVTGVREFLDGIHQYLMPYEEAVSPSKDAGSSDSFGARVFKISRDAQGNRLTYLKVTRGNLKVKALLTGTEGEGWEEKINQIRVYSGTKFEPVSEAGAGMVVAVTGLNYTKPGMGLGSEGESRLPVLEPVLNFQIILPKEQDPHVMLMKLKELEEEDPMLRIVWNEEHGEIHAQLMGEVQIEVLKSMIKERFQVDVSFGPGSIVYKETIANVVEGVGHYEPLRHYAEVHLKLEPAEAGTGMTFDSECSEDILDKNWQRLIMTHLAEKEHRGVLTGSAITDMRISIVAGRAHLKHTEGGDFRQSTYRAIRQGLMQAENVLLEPYYAYRLEIPADCVGRALNDIQRMNGSMNPPETDGKRALITGRAPVSCMFDYQMEVTSYTRGEGHLFCSFDGYSKCHNPEEVIAEIAYDPETDMANPTGSVFCAHGAGFYVPWNQVFDYMHVEKQLGTKRLQKLEERRLPPRAARTFTPSLSLEEEKELEEIFVRTYGQIERRSPGSDSRRVFGREENYYNKKKSEPVDEFLLVDGYNLIFSWDMLHDLAKVNIDGAREKLQDILCNYQGFKKCTVILVFDAYKVKEHEMSVYKYHNIHVVYTREAETADQYIEKVVHTIGRKYHVTVVTSDGVEQVIIRGQGASLLSSREFQEEYEIVRQQIREEAERRSVVNHNYLIDHMDEDLAEHVRDVRLGRKKMEDYGK